MLIGYARVSTAEQTLALQQDGLTQAGCERLFTDTVSGSQTERPGLDEVLDFLRPGDTLVVWRLDRLGRSLRHLIETISVLQARNIGFRSLQEQIDTTTSGGKLVFHNIDAVPDPQGCHTMSRLDRDTSTGADNSTRIARAIAGARSTGYKGYCTRRASVSICARVRAAIGTSAVRGRCCAGSG